MKLAHVFSFALLSCAGLAVAVVGETGVGSTSRDHRLLSATSADGLTWTRDEGGCLTSSSVPCAINDVDRRVLLYVVRPPDDASGVGGVACAISEDGTNFRLEAGFRIEGLSTLSAADPSMLKDAAGIAPATAQESAAAAGAFPLDANSRDAALFLTLPPAKRRPLLRSGSRHSMPTCPAPARTR